MKLYQWDGVLKNYAVGSAVVLASNEDEARRLALLELRKYYMDQTWLEVAFDNPRWDADSDAEGDIPEKWYRDREVVMGSPTRVSGEPMALCFRGSS